MMSRIHEIEYEFVDSAPSQLQLGKMYISTKYRAIVHLCLCGCNEKVLLKLDPDEWSVTFDGRSISIHDSVGNVGLPCRSHYIVRRNRVEWLRPLDALDPRLALSAEDTHGSEPITVTRRRRLARWLVRNR
jgi:hypothetical protein